ncbi:MAG: D-amino-acid transaminase [Micropepsaceae bacterium]
MSRIAYVNGRYLRHTLAAVHVEDRGFQFADGVYEVCAIRDGVLIDEGPHLARLDRSLGELRMRAPLEKSSLRFLMREVVRRNRVRDGLVYIQVSRGQARRDHGFPDASVQPTLVVTARSLDMNRYDDMAAKGVSVIVLPESRWSRCDIKSTGLLANVLAKQQAREAGAFEAWFVTKEGMITEGASTNAWIVDETGVLRTRPLGNEILPGVTRGEILSVCRQHNVKFSETPFTEDEAKKAREAFITAATIGALPVTQVAGVKLGDGKPGPIALKLREIYWSTRIT